MCNVIEINVIIPSSTTHVNRDNKDIACDCKEGRCT